MEVRELRYHHTYRPFQDLEIHWIQDNIVNFKLPWVDLDIEIERHQINKYKETIKSLRDSPEDEQAQVLLEELFPHKICYPIPRPIEVLKDLPSKLETPTSKSESFEKLQKEILSTLFKSQDFASKKWDIDHILSMCRIGETNFYDPVTFLHVLEEQRLIDEASSEKYRKELSLQLDKLRIADEEAFFDMMRLLLRQTHYVTSEISHALEKATHTSFLGYEKVQQFLNDEKGHDRLMSRGLRVLGVEDPESIEVLPHTSFLMALLQEATKSNILTVACLIGFFEGSDYASSDPLADVLLDSSKSKAADAYRIHYEINKNENHANFPFEMIKNLTYVQKEVILPAIQLLNLCSLIGVEADKYVFKRVEEKVQRCLH